MTTLARSGPSLRVLSAGPLVTTQDGGRAGLLRYGIPRSGPMDRLAHAVANVAVGNAATATAIEVSRGGVAVEAVGAPMLVGVAGGYFTVSLDGTPLSPWGVMAMQPGERLVVGAGTWGSWAYLAVAGGIDAAIWLGSASVHTPSGLGGVVLAAGSELPVPARPVDADRIGEIPIPQIARPIHEVAVVVGPQDRHAVDPAGLFEHRFIVSDASDRMGMRLTGPPVELHPALSIPSEPIVRGAIQVAGDGVPTVLMADHQTVGGYPKVAVVAGAMHDGVAQLRPGAAVAFHAVDPAAALELARRRTGEVQRVVDEAAVAGRTLGQRLVRENLIDGFVSTADSRSSDDPAGDADRPGTGAGS